MGLYDTVELMEDLPESFLDDGYEMSQEMIRKYLESDIRITDGQERNNAERFCKNASVYDVSGVRIAWGDIAPGDVKGMLGVYYVLSQRRSLFLAERGNGVYPTQLDMDYIKEAAIARIIDGQIQTSRLLIEENYT